MIIALHGRGSSAEESHTVNKIKEYFNEKELVFAPSYDSNEGHDLIGKYLECYVLNVVTENEPQELHIIGCSMGGYWARYLANKLNASNLVMINPSLHLYEGENVCESDSNELPITVFLGMEDEVVDPFITKELYKNRAKMVCYLNGGHRMQPELQYILPEIAETINTIIL